MSPENDAPQPGSLLAAIAIGVLFFGVLAWSVWSVEQAKCKRLHGPSAKLSLLGDCKVTGAAK